MIEPFFFGEEGKKLFGVYHPPMIRSECNAGIVLCYPMGIEYFRCHHIYTKLANILASAGIHVLRFDFFSCGDSDGDDYEATIGQWISDISSAVELLRSSYNLRAIHLFGCRLGGCLASMCGSELGNIDKIILWDPIVSGTDYLKELAKLHQHWQLKTYGRLLTEAENEVLGFMISDELAGGLKKIDLMTIESPPAHDVFLIESVPDPKTEYSEHLRRLVQHFSYKHISLPGMWSDLEKIVTTEAQFLKDAINWLCSER